MKNFLSRKIIRFQIALLVITCILYFLQDPTIEEEAFMDMYQLSEKYGYKIQNHQVITEDGYILALYRMTQQNDTPVRLENGKIQSVLIIHGNMEPPKAFMHNGHKSPAFILAREGFDVWFGKNRGNGESRKHQWLDPENDKEKFWDFSIQELGEHDVPAFIKYIVTKNEGSKVSYIGYSQGVGQFYYAMSGGCTGNETMREFYRENINAFISLGTTVKFFNADSFIMVYSSIFLPLLQFLSNTFGIYELKQARSDFMVRNVCMKFPWICLIPNYLLTDSSLEINDYNAVRRESAKPHGETGIRTLLHPAQLSQVDKWQCYDFGLERNRLQYGQDHPPEIPIHTIKDIPIAIYHGIYDRLTHIKDVDWLREQLNHTIAFYGEYELGHTTFKTAKNMSYFEVDVVNVLKAYAKK
ncbi:ab-hydrolase associated lipase region family protein [Stylonychia lemnae]|uniref:Ab-hydrolase associated lipase region family protein n=1 Tax=Stylonychia lemnae TaxID=5949 RepID=A0A078AR39_STYLE|nr:ab-hydrolase associated lipase region family protein [Stylonychia lemnae]|eukprot:CDW84870.1 ab-hydrolase associated lipase region family protein [Stylonychia lemnae]